MGQDTDTTGTSRTDLTALTADVVSAYVSNSHVALSDLPVFIATVHAALVRLSSGEASPAKEPIEKPTPAQIRRSITSDALISFIDGRPYKLLKRHLAIHGLTIQAYRERYGLPRDYPTVAAAYAETRSKLAREIGLGQVRRGPASELAPEKPKRAGRPRTVKEIP